MTERVTYGLPIPVNPVTTLDNPTYWEEMKTLGKLLAEGGGAVVYFLPEERSYIPPAHHLEATWSICHMEVAADGFLFYPCPPAKGMTAQTG